MKNVGKLLIILLCIFLSSHFLHIAEFFVKNYVYKHLPGEGTEKQIKLVYLGETCVDLSKSEIFSENEKIYDKYINCWQILGLGSYNYLYEEIGFDKLGIKIGTCFWGNSYVISYGRKLEKATYNTKHYWTNGYYVDFTFDMTEYQSGVVYIYKTDLVEVGNNEYS